MKQADKYDRQLRLWGARGQKALSESRVCLLGATGVGTETLKNLVLPGIGKFTIVDDKKVDEMDLATNFFVVKDRVGEPRCEVVRDLLVEMNPDVTGECVSCNPVEFMKNKERHKNEFSLVIITAVTEHMALEVATVCERLSLPFIIVRSYGFIGYLRIFTSEITIVESKPSPKPAEDIRVSNPFTELEQLVDSIQLDKMEAKEFHHVPYVILLIKLAQNWKSSHNGKLPSNTKEKKEFKELVKTFGKKPFGEEENIMEAMKQAYFAFGAREVPYDVEQILKDPILDAPIDKDTKSFWILAKALREFYQTNSALPLSGLLEDMSASTEMYNTLHNTFKTKFTQDKKNIAAIVRRLLEENGRPLTEVSEEEIELFCKNACNIQVKRYRTLDEEFKIQSTDKDVLMMAGMDGSDCLLYYIAIRACDAFHQRNGRFPGQPQVCDLEADAQDVLKTAQKIQHELDFTTNFSLKHAQEITRYGACEMHSIAAMMGGIAAQESVKLLTQQYTPLNNTMIFNGITCTAQVYEL